MKNKIKDLFLAAKPCPELDQLQNIVEKMSKDQNRLLDALDQILNCRTSACKCTDMFKCVFCHGHDVYMEVL